MVCPSAFSSSAAVTRVTWSVEPPAAQGTIRLIGRTGFQFCAAPGPAIASVSTATVAQRKKRFCMVCLPSWHSWSFAETVVVPGSGEPVLAMLRDERIVGQMGIVVDYARQLAGLPFAQPLPRIEAPDALQQPLPAQDLVATGDAAVEVVRDIEQRAVAIRDLRIERQKLWRHIARLDPGMNALEQLHGRARPYAPVTEQAAPDTQRDWRSVAQESERRQQVEHDVI